MSIVFRSEPTPEDERKLQLHFAGRHGLSPFNRLDGGPTMDEMRTYHRLAHQLRPEGQPPDGLPDHHPYTDEEHAALLEHLTPDEMLKEVISIHKELQ